MSDAGGWTLLPGKDGKQSFCRLFNKCTFSLLYCPGHCAGGMPVAQKKMSRSYDVALYKWRCVIHNKILYNTIFFTGNYNVPIEVYSNLNYLKGTLCMPIYIFYIV